MNRKWVIVAFGDIRGFMEWSRRGVNSPEVQDPFISRFYAELENFVVENGYYFKYLGDGMMILKELPEGHKCGEVEKFIVALVKLTKKLLAIIRGCPWPQPDGFRTRIVSGHVNRLEVTSGKVFKHNQKVPEYVGYAVNLAERLLDIKPEISVICHESVVKILGPKKKRFSFYRVTIDKQHRKGVDKQDLKALWNLKI